MSGNKKHTLMVVNPGHFHAGLSLRQRHPLLSDEVYVYAEEGQDLQDFLRIVNSFNQRDENPTSWGMHVYRGHDYMDALLHHPPGDVVVLAGKNNSKLETMQRLHAAGLHVLGDKTWVTDSRQLKLVREIVASAPLAMDIMTERFEMAARLQKTLSCDEAVFGGFRDSSSEPGVYFKSVHHLYKLVNGQPLIRPAWYFDTGIQGEGITDVTTHLVDLAQWMIVGNDESNLSSAPNLVSARQWPTEISLGLFSKITGLREFPPETLEHVRNGMLHYLCNANIVYTMQGVAVEVDSIWDLEIPEGGGDTHFGILHGTQCDLVVDQNRETGFEPRLRVVPLSDSPAFAKALAHAIQELQSFCPGVGMEKEGDAYRINIPAVMHTGHEARFAQVLDQFLGYVDSGEWPARIGKELVNKYELLAQAHALSHR